MFHLLDTNHSQYGDYVPFKSQYRGVTPLDGIKAASKGSKFCKTPTVFSS